MNCMKCGAELKTEGVFCPDCLEEMKKYPVQPNISVQLPVRPAVHSTKKRVRRQRYIKPEDQIRHLKKVRNLLCAMLIFVVLAFAALTAITLQMLSEDDNFGIGQNYETEDTSEQR